VGGSCIILCCNHRSDRLLLDVGVCSSLCIWICCIRRSFIILVCIGLSVLFCFVLIRSFYFSVPGAGVSWGWSWGTVGVCVDDSLPASSDLVLSFGKLQLLRRRGTAREVLECTSAYLRQCSALRMYDP
jgi:hypothetical protein